MEVDEFGIPNNKIDNLKIYIHELKKEFGQKVMREIPNLKDKDLINLLTAIDTAVVAADDKLSLMRM